MLRTTLGATRRSLIQGTSNSFLSYVHAILQIAVDTMYAFSAEPLSQQLSTSRELFTPTLVNVGYSCSRCSLLPLIPHFLSDPEVVSSFRTFIPITTQRRFDLYPDIAEEFLETTD